MKTGVIVGTDRPVDAEQAQVMKDRLAALFPGVQFAIVTGASSVAFSFEDAS